MKNMVYIIVGKYSCKSCNNKRELLEYRSISILIYV